MYQKDKTRQDNACRRSIISITSWIELDSFLRPSLDPNYSSVWSIIGVFCSLYRGVVVAMHAVLCYSVHGLS